jgi:phosphoglycolate phosphatase
MLILFDIDGTLLVTKGAGIAAMGDAGREMFGEHFTIEGVEFSGRLDTLIWRDLAKLNGAIDADEHHNRFRSAYHRHLRARLNRDRTARLLPGVRELVEHLDQIGNTTLGLLTGNYPETGRLKIEAAGLGPDVFTIAAWGCEGDCRRDLPPLAMRRYAENNGGALAPDQVIIIGDTPHDIDCAAAHACRSIGVATGAFSVKQLVEAGAELAVADLSDTAAVTNWIMQQSPAVASKPGGRGKQDGIKRQSNECAAASHHGKRIETGR